MRTPLAAGVSIHAFRGEGDVLSASIASLIGTFQSTPSGGKATANDLGRADGKGVSIHAFRGEGDVGRERTYSTSNSVSIHAFRGEGDSPN